MRGYRRIKDALTPWLKNCALALDTQTQSIEAKELELKQLMTFVEVSLLLLKITVLALMIFSSDDHAVWIMFKIVLLLSLPAIVVKRTVGAEIQMDFSKTMAAIQNALGDP